MKRKRKKKQSSRVVGFGKGIQTKNKAFNQYFPPRGSIEGNLVSGIDVNMDIGTNDNWMIIYKNWSNFSAQGGGEEWPMVFRSLKTFRIP